jgi:hypothetical protein
VGGAGDGVVSLNLQYPIGFNESTVVGKSEAVTVSTAKANTIPPNSPEARFERALVSEMFMVKTV